MGGFYGINLVDCHLVEQIACTTDLVDHEENVADIHRDVAADVGIVVQGAHCAEPGADEVDTQKLAFTINNMATAVATRCVVLGEERHGHSVSPLHLYAPATILHYLHIGK